MVWPTLGSRTAKEQEQPDEGGESQYSSRHGTVSQCPGECRKNALSLVVYASQGPDVRRRSTAAQRRRAISRGRQTIVTLVSTSLGTTRRPARHFTTRPVPPRVELCMHGDGWDSSPVPTLCQLGWGLYYTILYYTRSSLRGR